MDNKEQLVRALGLKEAISMTIGTVVGVGLPPAAVKAALDREYNIWKIGTILVTVVALGIYLIPMLW